MNAKNGGGIQVLAYAILMWGIGALFLVLGILLRRGGTDLIHAYHREKVKTEDRAAYGRAFAKGLFVMAGAAALSGGAAVLWPSAMVAVLVILLAGIAAGGTVLWRVQRRYNGGVF